MSCFPPGGGVNTISDYTIQYIVGKGTYGSVYKAIHKQSGDIVALKKISYTDIGIPKSSTREIQILFGLKHPNIVHLREIVVDDINKENGTIPNHFYLVFDFIDNDLCGIVRAINKSLLPPLSCNILRLYIYQIVSVLGFLHGNHIIHRDIKLDNFLVSNNHHIYLCDFGLSRLITSSSRLSLPVYAVAYRSPEVLLEMQTYSIESDIWALGILISTIILGRTPFIGVTDREVMLDILSKCGVTPLSVRKNGYDIPVPTMRCVKEILNTGTGVAYGCERDREQLLDLCDRLLDLNPEMRPTCETILVHPFLKGILKPTQLKPVNEMKQCNEPLLNMTVRNKT